MDPQMGQVTLTSVLADPTRSMRGTLSVIGNGCVVTTTADISAPLGNSFKFLEVLFPIENNNFHLHLENFTISNFGNSSIDGSGLYLVNLGSGSLSHMIFSENIGRDGGAVYIDSSNDIELQYCIFKDNNASVYGGGVYVESESDRLSFLDCSFFANFAVEDGGV
jgi:hypothetical protein